MPWQTFPIQCTGGLIRDIPDIQLGMSQPGAAIDLVNFEPSIQGGYRRINGYTKWDSAVVPSASASTQLLGVAFFDGTVVVPREGKIYKSDGSGWTEIATGRTQTTRHRYTIINLNGTRKLVGLDGVNYPYSWDKSTFSNLTGTTDIQGASFAVQFKDHIFYAVGDHVIFSEPFLENDFDPASGAGDFYVPDDVTGMYVFRESLIIFTKSSIHSLSGSSLTDFQLTSLSESIGCHRSDTIQEVAGDIAFLSNDGVRLLGSTANIGDFSNQIASKAIQKLLADSSSSNTQFSSVVVREKSQYRLFPYNSSLPTANAIGWLGTQFQPQDPASFQWCKLEGFKVYAADSSLYGGQEYIVFISDTQYVYRMESGSDFDGTAIKARFFTSYISLEDPTLRKTIYKVNTFVNDVNGDISGTLSLSFDFGSRAVIQPNAVTFAEEAGGGALWGSFTWGSGLWSTPSRLQLENHVTGSGFNVSLQYSFEGDQAPFIIDTIVLEYYTTGRS